MTAKPIDKEEAMVIESLKAARTALTEAMKDKDMSDETRKRIKESDAALQKLLAKAEEAAKESGEMSEEGMDTEVAPMAVRPGHKIKKTVTVQHDGPTGEEEDDDGDGDGDMHDKAKDDGKDDGESESEDEGEAYESKRGYIKALLKESGIPQKMWSLDKLAGMTLKEAKAEIADKKAMIEAIREQTQEEIEFVPASTGAPVREADRPANMNSLFEGCAG